MSSATQHWESQVSFMCRLKNCLVKGKTLFGGGRVPSLPPDPVLIGLKNAGEKRSDKATERERQTDS